MNEQVKDESINYFHCRSFSSLAGLPSSSADSSVFWASSDGGDSLSASSSPSEFFEAHLWQQEAQDKKQFIQHKKNLREHIASDVTSRLLS